MLVFLQKKTFDDDKISGISGYRLSKSDRISECLTESDPMGANYRGKISEAKYGFQCQRWDTDEPHTRKEKPKNLDNNYCRNPNPDPTHSPAPWCYTTDPQRERAFCHIKACGCLKESDPMGATYRGAVSRTENGLECQRWDTDEPHTRNQMPEDLDHNYCRNPKPDASTSPKPWCYTTDPEVTYEFCSISTCGPCTGVIYDNKCFVATFSWTNFDLMFGHDGAVEECNGRGGKLANLYSQSHMNDVMKYIRRVHPSFTWVGRIGLKFDPEADKLTLRGGTDAPDGLKWEFEGRSTNADSIYMALAVNPDPSSIHQYLRSLGPHFPRDVLCEIE